MRILVKSMWNLKLLLTEITGGGVEISDLNKKEVIRLWREQEKRWWWEESQSLCLMSCLPDRTMKLEDNRTCFSLVASMKQLASQEWRYSKETLVSLPVIIRWLRQWTPGGWNSSRNIIPREGKEQLYPPKRFHIITATCKTTSQDRPEQRQWWISGKQDHPLTYLSVYI